MSTSTTLRWLAAIVNYPITRTALFVVGLTMIPRGPTIVK